MLYNYYVQHTTDWTELNVLLYDGTRVLTGLLLCVWLRLTTLNKRIWWWWWWWWWCWYVWVVCCTGCRVLSILLA